MARHLADHRTPSQGARLMRYVAIDRVRGDGVWRGLGRGLGLRASPATGNRRLVEFLRIARGRSV